MSRELKAMLLKITNTSTQVHKKYNIETGFGSNLSPFHVNYEQQKRKYSL